MSRIEKANGDEPVYFRDDKGKAFLGFAFVVYGLLLVGMLLSAAVMNLTAENWARPMLDTLQRIVPLVYIPAVVFFFARVRVYIVCLTAAYAYDLWFQFWSGGMSAAMLLTDYPVWTSLIVLTLIFGWVYRGFRFRWWFGAARKGHFDH